MSELRKSLVIGGERYNLAVGQAGEGPPGENTPGKAGVTYLDTAAQPPVLYVCTAAVKSGEQIECTWVQVGGAGSGSGENPTVTTVEPAEDDIPKVYFTGTLPTSKDDGDLQLYMRYTSKSTRYEYPVTLKVQGSSSASYPKKNFTLKLYKDSTYESKKKLAFKNWGEMNKFVLKAHWIDHSHVRNVGTAKIWGKIVESRSDYASLPEELRNAPNNGATDGFTVKVFANGVYQGLYEWIVPKDKLFGQDSDIATHSILNSEFNNQPTCAFATASPVMSGNWSEELQDDMSNDISTSFANLISFVAGATDDEFVANAENYFDVQSVIDFDIFARVFCIVDNLCRNQIFFTYDGMKWYEGCWDVDAVLGLPPIGTDFFAYNTKFQDGYIAYRDYGITNLLYERVETLFTDRFKARYAELRSGVLAIDNIVEVYERLTDTIKTYDGLLAEDYAGTTGGGAFTGIPNKSANNIQQIRNFVAQRIPYMDAEVANISKPIPCTGITISASSLTFTDDTSQTVTATVTPPDTTYAVAWHTSDDTVATVSDGVVTPVGDGECTITATCGSCSASCPVSVSGVTLADVNLLDGVTWEKGMINYLTGADIASTTAARTGYIEAGFLAGRVIRLQADSAVDVRMAFFDSNKTILKGFNGTNGTATHNSFAPENTAYIRVSIGTTAGSVTLLANYRGNLLSDAEEINNYYHPETGEFYNISGYNCKKIPVEPSATYVAGYIINGAFYDALGNYSGILVTKENGEPRYIETDENAYFAGLNYRVNDSEKAFFCVPEVVGSATVNLA